MCGALFGLALLSAQEPAVQTPAVAAGPRFEVASVKQNKSGDGAFNSNVPLGPGNVFPPTAGRISITGAPLDLLIGFAYKLNGDPARYTREHLPGWATTERFDVEARAAGNPTKDQVRLMMQSLLAERFHLGAHWETRETRVYAMVLDKTGKTGPRLRVHPADPPCSNVVNGGEPPVIDDGYPYLCGGLFAIPHTGKSYKFGARNISLEFFGEQLSMLGQLGREVIDKTGLEGNIDFTLEFAPDTGAAPASDEPPTAPTFEQAVAAQLGLKLTSAMGPVRFLIVDRLDHLAEN
jgi:uncharacterized protein (TIGR03435 family)